jgi:type IV pilus assembly protein PilE
MSKSKGFTLIELLIVIAIIAVLAGVVLLNILGFIGKGKDTTAKANMATLLANATAYYGVHKNFSNFSTDEGCLRVKAGLAKDGYTLVETTDTATINWCGCILLKEINNT